MGKLNLSVYELDFKSGVIEHSPEGLVLVIDPNDIFKVGVVREHFNKVTPEYRMIWLKYQPDCPYIVKTEELLKEIKDINK